MFRSATFKLTMWYLALVMAISLIFSLVLYHVTTGELSRSLHRETERIFTQFPVFQDDPFLKSSPDYSNGAHRILLRLVGFNIVVLFGAGFSSYWLARRTLEPIEAAHEQQKRFTADVSHELRTPLTALRMESEVALLNRQTSKQELRQTLTSNLEEVTKLEALVNNLLRLTQLEADTLQQYFSSLEADAIAQEALDQVQKVAQLRNITLKNSVHSAPVEGDHDSLVQLLIILLDNAIKYSPEGATITLTSRRDGDHIKLSVQDHGVGIERAALEHVFDRFYRADGSRNKAINTEGFGLGLSIAKMITDVHHGSITVASRPGHGTTATVSLPASEAAA